MNVDAEPCCKRSRGRSITLREVLYHISGPLAGVVRVNGSDKTLLVDGDTALQAFDGRGSLG
jgi:hypothetical protein